jgi:hypothetical protein
MHMRESLRSKWRIFVLVNGINLGQEGRIDQRHYVSSSTKTQTTHPRQRVSR